MPSRTFSVHPPLDRNEVPSRGMRSVPCIGRRRWRAENRDQSRGPGYGLHQCLVRMDMKNKLGTRATEYAAHQQAIRSMLTLGASIHCDWGSDERRVGIECVSQC